MIRIETLTDLLDRYDVLFIDLFGVLLDNNGVFNKALTVLEWLKNAPKTVILLSNAPRPSHVPIAIAPPFYHQLITSGDLCIAFLNAQKDVTYYYRGMDHNRVLCREITAIQERKTLADSAHLGFLLLTGPSQWVPVSGPMLTMDEIKQAITPDDLEFLHNAHALDIPLVCANNDYTVVLDHQTVLCAGALALYYEHIGGIVHRFGKPHRDMYEKARAAIPENRVNPKILMVGDSLATDITGAHQAGIDSLLCHKTGVHHNQSLEDLYRYYGIQPTYVIDELCLS